MELGTLRDDLKTLVAGFEPGTLTGTQAIEAVELFAEMKRLAETGQALAARRVEEANAWRTAGSRSVQEFLATKTGESPGGVGKLVDTARKLESLGPTRDALRDGKVSIDQAAAIARAAEVDPGCEGDLLDAARHHDLTELKKRAAKARAAGDPDEERRYQRQRHERELKTFVDDEGMGNVHWRTTLDEYSEFVSLHARHRDDAFKAAYRAGRRDPDRHLASDGMLRLVRASSGGDGSTPARDPRVYIHVTDTAVRRGHTQPGETCEIAGVGPVPVPVARDLWGTNPFVSLIETDGTDVHRIVRLGRRRPPEVDDALMVRDRCCVVPGCASTRRLEAHHLVPYAHTGRTTLDELALVCEHHHDLITHRGHRLEGGPGHWTWHPPQPHTGRAPPDQLGFDAA
jgi:hypothetical protein